MEVLALVLYPGVLLAAVVGLPSELATGTGWRLRQLLDARSQAALPLGALLSGLAATQLAIPYNPLPAADRNLLVAAVALLAALWLDALETGADSRSRLAGQACWLIALLAPALVAQSLLPQVLAAVAVPGQIPLKVASAVLYVASLPVVLGLLDRSGPSPVRALSWLPACGLLTSDLVPVFPGGPLGPLTFLAATGAVSVVTLGVAAGGRRLGAAYLRWLGALAVAVLAIAVATAVAA